MKITGGVESNSQVTVLHTDTSETPVASTPRTRKECAPSLDVLTT